MITTKDIKIIERIPVTDCPIVLFQWGSLSCLEVGVRSIDGVVARDPQSKVEMAMR